MTGVNRVAGYLGRVLDANGDPIGTCFQVAPRVLVTAWHVLNELGAATLGAAVCVDPLRGGDRFQVAVKRLDPVHDLAVLSGNGSLPDVTGPLTATDELKRRTQVSATGHAVLDDQDHAYRFLDAIGEWAGGTTRDDSVALGRMIADRVVPGMSGAPVIRESDNAVAGVVSGRYLDADGWPPSMAWVARTEDLLPLLDGLAEITMRREPLNAPVDLVLTVTAAEVRLSGPWPTVTAGHGGVRPGLAEAVNEVRRARARFGAVLHTEAQAGELAATLSLTRAGLLLGESFLPGSVATELERVLIAASHAHQPVRFGLAVDPVLAGLPWEALPSPDGRGPLALHPLVRLYRKAPAATRAPLPGPLRIVVAIAAPEDSSGALVDYERHLRSVISAVRAARQDDAEVTVVPFASLGAIRAELERAPAHVLHIYGHGRPGVLELEHDDGTARLVRPAEFLDEAIPAGAMPPLITLSACYTDAAAGGDAASFATELCAHGAAAVIGTETSVTDIYATRLFARLYGRLAQPGTADVIAALAAVRRDVQHELETSPGRRDQKLSTLSEWAVVTVLAAAPSVAIVDTSRTATATPRRTQPRVAGLAARGDWYFVGRRTEQRRWPADLLAAPGPAGIVIHAIGGAGKTTLAAELAAQLRDQDPAQIQVSLTGPLTLEGLLGELTSVLRRTLLVRGDQSAVAALDVAASTDVGWADRLAVLREHVLDHVPVLMVLDNFEDNLWPEATTGYAVGDEVLGGLLGAWVADPGRSRLLITSRHPFTLPGGAQTALSFRPLGALSRAETMKLAWSLPALDKLDETQLDQVWRHTGGHPRSLEYLDALLAGGTARYPDVTDRLQHAIGRRLSQPDNDRWQQAATSLDAALAQTIALAADDILLDDLLARVDQVPGARDVLVGISVYREPVDRNAVLFQAGQPDPAAEDIPDHNAAYQHIADILADAGIPVDNPLDLSSVPAEVREQLAPLLRELNRLPVPPFTGPPGLAGQLAACQAASLLHVDQDGQDQWFFVHRWTATELSTRPASRSCAPDAHGRAAQYWLWRVRVWPQGQAADVHDLLEARYHLLQAGDTAEADQVTEVVCSRLDRWGAWDQQASLIHDALSRLPAGSPRRAVWIYRLGKLAQDRGDYDEAARQYQRSLDIFERLGNQANMAATYGQLGVLAYLRGDYDEATRQYQCSLDISERLGNQAGMATTYHQLGILAQDCGDYDEAARQYQRSLDIEEQLGNQAGMADSYGQLGNLAYIRGDYDEAIRQYQRALDIFERLGDQVGMAATYHHLGMLAQERGDDDEATRQYQRSLDINERLGNQANMATTYHQLGILAQDCGDDDEAARQYQRSLDISERLGDQAGMAATYHQLGMLAQERGDDDEAARQYQRSLDINERLGNQAGMATTYQQLGTLAHDRGEPAAESIAWHLRALTIRLRLGAPQAVNSLRRLVAYRRQLGHDAFGHLIEQTGSDPAVTSALGPLLDQVDEADKARAAESPGSTDPIL